MRFRLKGRLGFWPFNQMLHWNFNPKISKWWLKNSLERMPTFTPAEMNQHIKDSEKRVGNADHHSIPTNLRKAKTFLKDAYLRDIEANSYQRYFDMRAKCYHSFRKKDAPQSLWFVLCVVLGQVMHANCLGKAGNVSNCNHVLALLFRACKFSFYDSKKTDDLNLENDEHPDLGCTSNIQRWHTKGCGDNIHPQPLMEITVWRSLCCMKLGWILTMTSSQKWNLRRPFKV